MSGATGSLARVRAALARSLEHTVSFGFAALTVDVLWGVFSRYVLGAQSRWTEEAAIYLLIWVSLLGSSLAYAERGHLGVDYLVEKLHPSARRLAAILSDLLVLTFAGVVLLYGGGTWTLETLRAHQLSPSLGINMGWVYLAAPLSGCFFVLFGVEHLAALARLRAEES